MQGSDFSEFSPLQFAETGGPVVSSPSGMANLTGTLQIRSLYTNTARLLLTAQAAGGLAATQIVTVAVVPMAGLAPQITTPPAAQTVQCGSNATFSVTATGAAPLSYQWYWQGTNQVGTNATLILDGVSLASAGGYTVVVTNSAGSAISPAAILNVVDTLPPVITLLGANPMQVVQNTSFADPGATAYDGCAGGVPVTASGSVNIGVTGTYTVSYAASDPSGNSATNTRSVVVVAPAVACDPAPGGIAGWWKGESNTVDAVGGNSGTLAGGAGYVPGLVGTAFSFGGSEAAVVIPYNPATDLSALYNWTIEAWINPASFNNTGYPTIYSQGILAASLGLNSTDGKLESWLNDNDLLVGTVPVPLGHWSHVALVYDGTNRTFYVNGAFAGSGSAPTVGQNNSGSAIGNIYQNLDGQFDGAIDEVSVYGRALSLAEIAGIYGAGAAGKCAVTGTNLDVPPYITVPPADQVVFQGSNAEFTVTASGSAPLSYQWRENGTNLVDDGGVSGVTTTNLALADVSASAAGEYSVVVSNLVGSRISAPATLVIIAPPANGITNTFWDAQSGNNNWSQGGASGNWIDYNSPQGTPYYPNGTNFNVTLDNAGGATANLNVSVTLNTLTLLNNGGLNIPSGSTLTVSNLYFQGDSGITQSGCCSPENVALNGGTLGKTLGTNVSTIDPAVILTSVGGTLAVDSGTLALPGNNSYYTNGAFEVASNATLVLVPGGNTANFAGTFTGSGTGKVLLNAGTLSAAAGGLTLDVPSPLLQWTGGTLVGGNPLTNAGVLDVLTTNGVYLNYQLDNAGLVTHSGPGDLYLNSSPGAHFENLAPGTYMLGSDAGIAASSCCSPTVFDNFGLFEKSGGTGDSVISLEYKDPVGSVDVQTGTLTLANGGTTSNGTFAVAAGATLDVTGGSQSAWTGQITGTGAGTVLLANGTVAAPGVTLNFVNGLFQWSGGTLQGPVTNVSVVSISGPNTSILSYHFYNEGLVREIGIGGLDLNSAPGADFENLAGATYQFENDGSIGVSSCCSPTIFSNRGLLRKIGGTNDSRIAVTLFNNLGGMIEVDTGTVTLASAGNSSNGTFTVSGGAALDLTGGASPTWAGEITGTGNGSVELNSGQIVASPSLTLDFPTNMFQWTGGTFNGLVLNNNALAISGAGGVLLSGTISNAGVVHHLGAGNFGLNSAPGSHFENLAAGTYRLESAADIYVSSCCSPVTFDNFGAFIKTVSSSNSVISVPFNNLGGLVDVEPGLLTLANSGSSSNGTFTVATGAMLDITGGQSPNWAGRMNGVGGGSVMLQSGTLTASPSLALNFVNGMFQWAGATVSGLVTNINTLSLSGTNNHLLTGHFYNSGLVRHTGGGQLGISSASAALFRNLPGGTYEFETDTAFYVSSCCSPATFENDGLLRKTGGASDTTISVLFNNLGGTVEVDAGQLTLANSGSSLNGAFLIAAGAGVDLTGGAQPTWSGRLTGFGAGTLGFNSGTIFASGLILDCAPGLFQWTGGTFSGPVTNANSMDISGGAVNGNFFNAGVVRQLGSSVLGLNSSPGALFRNLPGATYEFQGDGSVSVVGCCSPITFENDGLLRKTGGTNSSAISTAFNNQGGSIEVDSGVLSVSGSYAQGGGALTVLLGGTNAGQYGRLSLTGGASLGGALNVRLANGYVPASGAQFQVLACGSLSGAFTATKVPAGMSVAYSGNGVFLTLTSAVSAIQITSQPARPNRRSGREHLLLRHRRGSRTAQLPVAIQRRQPRGQWAHYRFGRELPHAHKCSDHGCRRLSGHRGQCRRVGGQHQRRPDGGQLPDPARGTRLLVAGRRGCPGCDWGRQWHAHQRRDVRPR